MNLSNANDVPGTDGRWYFGLIERATDHVMVTVYEKEGARRWLRWRMEGRPLKGQDIDPDARRRVADAEDAT